MLIQKRFQLAGCDKVTMQMGKTHKMIIAGMCAKDGNITTPILAVEEVCRTTTKAVSSILKEQIKQMAVLLSGN